MKRVNEYCRKLAEDLLTLADRPGTRKLKVAVLSNRLASLYKEGVSDGLEVALSGEEFEEGEKVPAQPDLSVNNLFRER